MCFRRQSEKHGLLLLFKGIKKLEVKKKQKTKQNQKLNSSILPYNPPVEFIQPISNSAKKTINQDLIQPFIKQQYLWMLPNINKIAKEYEVPALCI